MYHFLFFFDRVSGMGRKEPRVLIVTKYTNVKRFCLLFDRFLCPRTCPSRFVLTANPSPSSHNKIERMDPCHLNRIQQKAAAGVYDREAKKDRQRRRRKAKATSKRGGVTRSKRKRKIPNRFIEEYAKESSRTERCGKPPAKSRTRKHALDDDSDDDMNVLRSKHIRTPKKLGNKKMQMLERDEMEKSNAFLASSDDEDETHNGLTDLVSKCSDFQLLHGHDITEKIREEQRLVRVERDAKRRSEEREALHDLNEARKQRSICLVSATANISTHDHSTTNTNTNNTNHTNNSTNTNNMRDSGCNNRNSTKISTNTDNSVNITINNTAPPFASVSDSGFPVANPLQMICGSIMQQNMMQLNPVDFNTPTFPLQNVMPTIPVGGNLPITQGSLYGQSLYPAITFEGRRTKVEDLISTYHGSLFGDQNARWLQIFQRALAVQRRGGSLKRGYNSIDDGLSSWVSYQRKNLRTLHPIKIELLGHIGIDIFKSG